MKLTEEMKDTLLEYSEINNRKNELLYQLDLLFNPLIEEAYREKDMMKLIQIEIILPTGTLSFNIRNKILELQKQL